MHYCTEMRSLSSVLKIKKRYFVSICAGLGGFILRLIRSNLDIAIIDMASVKTITTANKTEILAPEFEFNMRDKGLILGANSVGYLLSFFTGFLPHQFGGVTIFGIAVLLTGILTVLSPLLIRLGLFAFIFARILQGLMEGLSLASNTEIFVVWAPPAERTRLVMSSRIGVASAVAVNFPLSGYIVYHWGWEAIFYLSGALALLWCVVWFTFVSNDPTNDKFISEDERSYLKSVVPNASTEKLPFPWKKVFTSKPVYALINEFFCFSWAYVFTFHVPLYFQGVLNVNIQDVGLISGIPMTCGAITMFIAAWGMDYLRTNNISVSKLHKMVIFWSELTVLISLFISAIWGNFWVCIICFTIMRVAFCVSETSYIVIPMDMAGPYGGFLLSFCASVTAVGDFFSPLLMGCIVKNNTQLEWNLYFLVLGFIMMYGIVMFCIFGSGELQPWATPEKLKRVEDQNHMPGLQLFNTGILEAEKQI